jgi:hypothetical protein
MDGPDPADVMAIVCAAGRGNLPEVQRHVQKDRRLAEAEILSIAYSTPLAIAARSGQLEVVRYLVEEMGVDVNRVGRYPWRPLFAACRGGRAAVVVGDQGAVVDYLLGKGADPWPLKERWSALMTAVEGGKGSEAAIKVLLTYGGGGVCDVDDQTRGGGHTALHCAIMCGRTENARLLLEAGADWRAADRNGRTAMALPGGFLSQERAAEFVALIQVRLSALPSVVAPCHRCSRMPVLVHRHLALFSAWQEWEYRYLLSKARRLCEDTFTLSRPASPRAASQGRVRAAPAYLAARGYPQVEVRSLEVEGASGSGTGKRAHAEEGSVGAVREQVLRFALEGMKAELFRELGEVGGMCGW